MLFQTVAVAVGRANKEVHTVLIGRNRRGERYVRGCSFACSCGLNPYCCTLFEEVHKRESQSSFGSPGGGEFEFLETAVEADERRVPDEPRRNSSRLFCAVLLHPLP